jgi:hypothetical protein
MPILEILNSRRDHPSGEEMAADAVISEPVFALAFRNTGKAGNLAKKLAKPSECARIQAGSELSAPFHSFSCRGAWRT